MKTKFLMLSFVIMMLFSACTSSVSTPSALASAVANAAPGDTIIIANGTWENVEIDINGKGEENNPIVVKVEEEGKVIVSGQSF